MRRSVRDVLKGDLGGVNDVRSEGAGLGERAWPKSPPHVF